MTGFLGGVMHKKPTSGVVGKNWSEGKIIYCYNSEVYYTTFHKYGRS